MTRINLVHPQELTDQHLLAEIKEINQLCGQYLKSLNSRKGIGDIPSEFTLGKGHVKFFYNKGAYLNFRFNFFVVEALSRGFDIEASFNQVFLPVHYGSWLPSGG